MAKLLLDPVLNIPNNGNQGCQTRNVPKNLIKRGVCLFENLSGSQLTQRGVPENLDPKSKLQLPKGIHSEDLSIKTQPPVKQKQKCLTQHFHMFQPQQSGSHEVSLTYSVQIELPDEFPSHPHAADHPPPLSHRTAHVSAQMRIIHIYFLLHLHQSGIFRAHRLHWSPADQLLFAFAVFHLFCTRHGHSKSSATHPETSNCERQGVTVQLDTNKVGSIPVLGAQLQHLVPSRDGHFMQPNSRRNTCAMKVTSTAWTLRMECRQNSRCFDQRGDVRKTT